LAYLRTVANLADTAAWMRVLTREEGIGPAGAVRLIEGIRKVEAVEQVKDLGRQILGERARTGWNNFSQTWDLLLEAGKNPAGLIGAVLESPYCNYLEDEYVDSRERKADIEQMKIFANKYESLDDFLAEATLQESFNIRGANAAMGQPVETKQNKIVLSTIHQAKGLEWSQVFVLNLATGAFPNDRALRESEGLEEERRLFYVAITRAKKNLCLTYPMAAGGWGDSVAGPSMFLGEISADLLDDYSLLSPDKSTVFNGPGEVTYVSEDDDYKPLRIQPGSFLRSIEDL
jgi:DNA helicase II / ATP-dependent DNA helicase PcrA